VGGGHYRHDLSLPRVPSEPSKPFDKAYELETELEARGKTEMLEFVQNRLPRNITASTIAKPRRLAWDTPCYAAKPALATSRSLVLLADDLLDGQPPVMNRWSMSSSTTIAR